MSYKVGPGNKLIMIRGVRSTKLNFSWGVPDKSCDA